MATFYGGEQLLNIVRIQGTNASGTFYTCPAGRNAKVKIMLASAAGGFTINFSGSGNLTMASGNSVNAGQFHSPEADAGAVNDVFLLSGETISSGSNVTYSMVIFEYANP